VGVSRWKRRAFEPFAWFHVLANSHVVAGGTDGAGGDLDLGGWRRVPHPGKRLSRIIPDYLTTPAIHRGQFCSHTKRRAGEHLLCQSHFPWLRRLGIVS